MSSFRDKLLCNKNVNIESTKFSLSLDDALKTYFKEENKQTQDDNESCQESPHQQVYFEIVEDILLILDDIQSYWRQFGFLTKMNIHYVAKSIINFLEVTKQVDEVSNSDNEEFDDDMNENLS